MPHKYRPGLDLVQLILRYITICGRKKWYLLGLADSWHQAVQNQHFYNKGLMNGGSTPNALSTPAPTNELIFESVCFKEKNYL